MRATFLTLLTACVLCSAAAWAQTAPAPQRDALQRDQSNQRVERIHVEDSRNRVDELRIGGETQSITVQPKADVPAYDVRPADASRSVQSGNAGQRTWKVFRF
ncbi:MAG: hypothetical protein LBQ32_04125 [Burkholderiaceae bacterium]|jgi:hypothetical protein|nr:hypothetical protein [Burkholderiaceae bacterium]